MAKEKKEIVITDNSRIFFPYNENGNGNTLIIGNFHDVCGPVYWHGIGTGSFGSEKWDDAQINNLSVIVSALKSIYSDGKILAIVASKECIAYFQRLVYTILDSSYGFENELTKKEKGRILAGIRKINIDKVYEAAYKIYESKNKRSKECAKETIDDIVVNKIFNNCDKVKFDTIIQNPPYNGTLHLSFFEKGLDILSENGKMVIIEPATWLINLNPNSTYVKGRKDNHTPEIKKRIDGHVESVKIENLDKDFGTRLFTPFAITTIDMSKTFDTIKFACCGEEKEVKSIYDCNLIGDYTMVHSIIEKCQKFGDVMANHITNKDMGGEYWYAKFEEKNMLPLCQLESEKDGRSYDGSKSIFIQTKLGEFYSKYFTTAIHYIDQEPSDKPLCKRDAGKHMTDKVDWNVYGTETEIKNWKHFIFNNKLPLFVNMVITISQDNPNKDLLPWLVDKQYTDEEINEMFGFTEEEIAIIDRTIKKYERSSPWFKRYMCGPDSVSDEEVNNFIKSL